MKYQFNILATNVRSVGTSIALSAALTFVLSCKGPVSQSDNDRTSEYTFSTPTITNTQVGIRVWNDSHFRVSDLRLYFRANLGTSGTQSHVFGKLDSNGTTGYAVMDLSRNVDGTAISYDTYQVIDIFRSYYDWPPLHLISFPTGYYTYVLRYHDSTFILVAPHFMQDSAGQPPTGVNVRVHNRSQEDYDSVWVFFPDTMVTYSPLASGAYSFYVEVSSSYEQQSTRVRMGRKTAEYWVEDHLGARLLPAGYYTFGLDLEQMTKYRDIGFLKQDHLPVGAHPNPRPHLTPRLAH